MTGRYPMTFTLVARKPSDVAFRYARATDCAAIVALVESAYRGESSRAGWTTEADLLGGQRTDVDDIAAILAEPESRLLLATQGDAILGSVLLRRERDGLDGLDGLYLGMLAVRPQLQAQGLGRRLLTEAESRGRQEFGAKRARMTVIEQRRDLIAWYERRGYGATGHTEPFPYDNPRFGLPKRDDLRFIVLAKDL
jgi:ribosomal protein S18 acetylase RimI-like enzyme